MTVVEMSPTRELLTRLERLQAEIIEIDGLLKSVCGSKACSRLVANLIETANAIEAMLLVKS